LLTKSGIKTLNLHVSDGVVESVTVDMGAPQLENPEQFIISRELDKGTFVSMGNPHYVIFTDNVDQVGETGRVLEHHPAFPQRCNIEFVAPLPPEGGALGCAVTPPSGGWGAFRVRVWERGSGITQACGTGACATAVAAFITGRAARQSQIVMDGGTLHIELRESDNHVLMTGPAEFVFDGEIDINE
jgi:diaminopimelate epimerase